MKIKNGQKIMDLIVHFAVEGKILLTYYIFKSEIIFEINFSVARRPIGPGCRVRRFKHNLTTINRILTASDEENTEECSHPPSSQSSTLESNQDAEEAYRAVNSRGNHGTNGRFVKIKQSNKHQVTVSP